MAVKGVNFEEFCLFTLVQERDDPALGRPIGLKEK
jgi:hypothetical protein